MRNLARDGDSQSTTRLGRERCDLRLRRLDLRKAAQAPCKVRLSRRCYVELACGAADQRHPEILLEASHFSAHCRVRHAEDTGGLAETAGPHDLHEYGDVVE